MLFIDRSLVREVGLEACQCDGEQQYDPNGLPKGDFHFMKRIQVHAIILAFWFHVRNMR